MSINETMLEEAIAFKNADMTIAALSGGKARITIGATKWEDVKEGKRFWVDLCEKGLLGPSKWELITIVNVRSGVAFFTKRKNGKEDYILEGSLTHLISMEPESFVTELDGRYYEIVSKSGKVKVDYRK